MYAELSEEYIESPVYDVFPFCAKNVVSLGFDQPLFPASIVNPNILFASSAVSAIEGTSSGSNNISLFLNPDVTLSILNFMFGSENPTKDNSSVPNVAYLEAIRLTSNLVISPVFPTFQI